MNTTLDKISHKAQRAAASVIIDKVLAMVDKDREKGFLELVDWAEQFWGNGFSKEDYDKVRAAIKDPDNRWIKLIPHLDTLSVLSFAAGSLLPTYQLPLLPQPKSIVLPDYKAV